MNTVNLSYNYIAAFFQLMLIIWYFTEKKVPLRSYRYFIYVLSTAFGATVLETLVYGFAEKPDIIPYGITYTIMSVQMIFIHSFFVCITHYLLSLAGIDTKRNPKFKYTFVASWGIIVVICGLNPILHWAANLIDHVYSIKGVGFVLYAVDAVMVVLMAWGLIAKRQNFKFLKKTIVVFLFVCAIIAGIAQEFSFTPMLNLAITVFCIVLYLFVQGPEVDIDKLTGQFSRRFFGTYLKDKFLLDKPFSLLVINLDDFKLINQSYGVSTGDVLLCQVGEFLENMNSMNIVFHHGADQFCVVIDKEQDAVNEIVERIYERFEHPWSQEKLEIMMSATMCVIHCPQDSDSAESLEEVIGYTMETAKNLSKGGIIHASDIDLEQSHMSQKVERAVKAAIANDSIQVYYQPIYSADKQCYNSAEALARLHDEELGWIPPDVFITVAEKTGNILELGEIILHKVCRFIRENNLSQTNIEYIEINVSSLQLMQKGFAEQMLSIMKLYEVKSSQINIEITETAMLSSFSVVSDNLDRLIENDIAITLDDYGSGYANINYINKMPFKYIKLDRDIVQASFEEEKAHITLEHTVKMLNALDMLIVAEGVETDEMREALIQFGCHYLQGWYFSKAIPDKEFMDLIHS